MKNRMLQIMMLLGISGLMAGQPILILSDQEGKIKATWTHQKVTLSHIFNFSDVTQAFAYKQSIEELFFAKNECLKLTESEFLPLSFIEAFDNCFSTHDWNNDIDKQVAQYAVFLSKIEQKGVQKQEDSISYKSILDAMSINPKEKYRDKVIEYSKYFNKEISDAEELRKIQEDASKKTIADIVINGHLKKIEKLRKAQLKNFSILISKEEKQQFKKASYEEQEKIIEKKVNAIFVSRDRINDNTIIKKPVQKSLSVNMNKTREERYYFTPQDEEEILLIKDFLTDEILKLYNELSDNEKFQIWSKSSKKCENDQ